MLSCQRPRLGKGAQQQGVDPAVGAKLLQGPSLKLMVDLQVLLGGQRRQTGRVFGSRRAEGSGSLCAQLSWGRKQPSVLGADGRNSTVPRLPLSREFPAVPNQFLLPLSQPRERWAWSPSAFLSPSPLHAAPCPASVLPEGLEIAPEALL